jgi:hypothetical protein
MLLLYSRLIIKDIFKVSPVQRGGVNILFCIHTLPCCERSLRNEVEFEHLQEHSNFAFDCEVLTLVCSGHYPAL